MPKQLHGKCIECSDNKATFYITGTLPDIDKHYYIKDATKKTNAQNNTLHDVLTIFFKWMLERDIFKIEDDGKIFDLSCADVDELKNIMKQRYGAGFEKIFYANNKGGITKVDHIDHVPEYAWDKFYSGQKDCIHGHLKSYADYTAQESRHLISMTFLVMDRFGCDDKEYLELREYFDKKTQLYLNELANKFNGELM